jgi:hypothetical protein
MVNNSKDRTKDRIKDKGRRPTLVFQDNRVPKDNGVLHEEMRVVESTQLNVATTKGGLRKTVCHISIRRPPE